MSGFRSTTNGEQKASRKELRPERLFLAVANLGTHAALFAPQLSPTLT
jgi:hypothetical protein